MEHSLFVKGIVLPLFEQGKSLEIRTKTQYFLGFKEEEVIVFNKRLRRKIVAVRDYPNFDEMLKKEDAKKIHPTMPVNTLLRVLRQYYPQNMEGLGVLVFELAII